MTKLDEMIESEVAEHLNPEGDRIADYAELLPDDYAMHSEHWHNAIESSVNPTWYVTGKGTQPIYDHIELSDDDLESIVDGIISGDGLYEIEVRYMLCRSRPKDFASYAIGELEIQLPEDLDSYESEEYCVKESWGTYYAYVNTDEVVTFVLDRDQIIEFLDDQSEAA